MSLISEENRDASQEAKAKGMEAISDGLLLLFFFRNRAGVFYVSNCKHLTYCGVQVSWRKLSSI